MTEVNYYSQGFRTILRFVIFSLFFFALFFFASSIGEYREAKRYGTTARSNELYGGMIVSVVVLTTIILFSFEREMRETPKKEECK